MKFRLQLVTVSDAGQEQVPQVGEFERAGVAMETLVTLAEGKLIRKNVQANLVQEQVNDAWLQSRGCPECGRDRQSRGHHDITVRTVFGNVELQSPRLGHCPCQPHAEKTFSPLQTVLPEHVSPEWLYLEAKWSFPDAVRGELRSAARRAAGGRETQRGDHG
jgi:hypothetical protein